MSINLVIISGNVGRDAELRQTPSGLSVLKFSVAVNDYKRLDDGTYESHTNWVTCTLFGPRAEKLAGRLVKGAKVCVEGKLRYTSWVNKQGQKRSSIEVVVNDVEFMSRPEEPAREDGDLYDEDIPF